MILLKAKICILLVAIGLSQLFGLSDGAIPTAQPTFKPSASFKPSIKPTISPTVKPTSSMKPSAKPTANPSIAPTKSPTAQPTLTRYPTIKPSIAPTIKPSVLPSLAPSVVPTFIPPTRSPTQTPPSISPTKTAGPTLDTDINFRKFSYCNKEKLGFQENVTTDCILSVPLGSDERVQVDAMDMLDFQISYEQANPLKILIDLKPDPFPDFLISKYPKDKENTDKLVGIALDGIPIYTALDYDGDDMFQKEMGVGGKHRIDKCGGTYGPTPDGFRYHYRVLPACILKSEWIFNDNSGNKAGKWNDFVKRRREYIDDVHELLQYFYDQPGPNILGYTITGFPIYSPFDARGRLQTDLDSCNGKFVNNSYGYYVTLSFPYIVGCDGPGVLDTQVSDLLTPELLPFVAGHSYTSCPGGYFPSPDIKSNGCIPCPAGKFSLSSYSIPGRDPCSGVPPPGYYTTKASTKPIICAAGRYGSSYGLTTADCSGACERGFYCPEGSISKTQFPCGNETVFCPAGTGVKYIVDIGFRTGPPEVSEKYRHYQVECLPGSFCLDGVSKPCPAGRFGVTKALSNVDCTDVCPVRHYCPEGSVNPIPCPAGTYGVTTNLSTPACSGQASRGHWTPEGSISPAEGICAPGSYGAEYGLTTKECSPDCEIMGAPNGTSSLGSKYCSVRKCSAGYICPAGSISAQNKTCGAPNVYCPPGSAIPTPVDVGYYTIDIDGGYSVFDTHYPAIKATSPISPDLTTAVRVAQVLCEPGYYCTAGLKYKCPMGSYGGEYGQTTPVCSGFCLPGYYCHTASDNSRQNKCGSGPEVYCPLGSYQSTIVPDGYYSINGTTTTRSAINKCLPGSYCINGIKRLCHPGTYSVLGSPVEGCDGLCAAGWYCLEGSSSSKQHQCPGGRFGVAGMVDAMCAGACIKGYYCPATSTTPYQKECGGENFYCPHGSPAPIPVSSGYYSTGNNVTTRFAQSACQVGTNTGTPPASDERSNVCPSTTVP